MSKQEMYKCKSYVNDDGIIQDCTCGKCTLGPKRKEDTMDNNDFNNPSQEKLEAAAKPLIKYLAENYHPHVKCIVDGTTVEVLEGQMMFSTKEFLRD